MQFGIFGPTSVGRLLGIGLLFFGLVALAPSAGAQDLGSAELHIAGTRLVVEPAAQTVPFDTPTIIGTSLLGYDTSLGTLPPDLVVVGELVGPEINGSMRLETVPGEPFRIPRLRLKGDYALQDIRLEQEGRLLAYADPREATVKVTRILITSVRAQPMTQDEIRSYGLVIGDDSYQAFNLVFGMGLLDQPNRDFVLPVVYRLYGHGLDDGEPDQSLSIPVQQGATVSPRFQPPTLQPFKLDLLPEDREAVDKPKGGCDLKKVPCRQDKPKAPPMVGVILFPSDINLLHQFFSVVLTVQNGAPEGDVLSVRDLTAKARLPSGLRAAETDPPTPLGVPVPVRAPGPDGEVGTADDLNLLVAQATGEADFLVEGLKEGSHIVEFDLQGVLEGMPGGPRPILGKAKGAVVVRDPTLGVNVTHPEVVRAFEHYIMGITISNLGNAPVNDLEFSLPASGLAGVELAEGQASSATIDSLMPGESELVEFEIVPQISGRVIASSSKSGSAIQPTFDFDVSVRNGVAVSPNSLVMPEIVHELPRELYRELITLAGLGHSLSTAPAGGNPDAPRIDRQTLHHRTERITEAARWISMGESEFDAVSLLSAEWLGARDGAWEWDRMRRETDRGLTTSQEMAVLLESESSSLLDAFERFAADTGFLGLQAVAAYGTGTRLELMSRTSGKRIYHHAAGGPVRDLPFADTLSFTTGDLGVLARPEDGGYRAVIRRQTSGSFGLRILLPPTDGELSMRTLEWNGVPLDADEIAWVEFDREDLGPILEIDENGDGLADRTEVPVLGTLAPRPVEAIAAIQQGELDPTGHVVHVLFSADIDLESLGDPASFTIPGKKSNGGMTPVEASVGIATGYGEFASPRIVRVIFTNPLSPLLPDPTMTVRAVRDTSGRTVSPQSLLVELNATEQAMQVHGKVIDPYGQPLPFADVYLEQTDRSGRGSLVECRSNRTAYVQADAEGNYRFDYVRKTPCSDRFTVLADSPHGPHKGQATDRVRVVGTDEKIDIVMVGRGIVSGTVRYDDGTVPTGLEVFAHNPVFDLGRRAWVGENGEFRMAEVAVGTVTLWAQDDRGNRVFQTIEVPVAGAQVERDMIMIKRPDAPTARVSGIATDAVTGEPEFDAYVALYVDDVRINVTRTAADGSFDFGVVPTGPAEIEAFDGVTGKRGTQVAFNLEPDQHKTLALELRDDRGTIHGYVRRKLEDGTVVPIADAVVWAKGTPFNTTTDENGYYQLEDVFPGNRRIFAADLEANEKTDTHVSIAPGQTQQADLLFVDQLEIVGGLTGQVLDEDGLPVEGAVIHLAGGYWSLRWSFEVHSDANGEFSISGLGPGRYGVHAYKGLSGGLAFGDIRFPGDSDSVVVRFQSGTIRGRTVVREADNTLQGVRSTITYRTTRVVNQWGLVAVEPDFNHLQTDGNGYFEIPALHGPYELFFYNPFHEGGYRKVTGSLGPIEPDLEIVYKQNGSISGTVYQEDGVTPAAGAKVELRGGSFSNYDLTSDADGRFTFELVPPGRYHVTATIDEGLTYRTERVFVQMRRHGAEMDIKVVLQKRGRVEGWVLDAGGIAVPGAVVELRERGFPHRRLVGNADENGQYSFDNVFEGDVTLRAKAPELGGLRGHDKAEVTDEDQTVFTEITLEGAADVRGRVFNPETGEPVPNARVSIYLDGWIRSFVDSTQTDSDGFYEIRGLKLRNYNIRVFDPATGRRGLSRRFDLSFHEEIWEQDITLEVRGTVQGHLYDPDADNIGVPGATLELFSRGIRWFKTYSSTDIDGFYTFEGIPEGEFSVSTFGHRRRARGDGEIEFEDQVYELDLYLERMGSLATRILAARTGPDDTGETLVENVTGRVWEAAWGEGLVGASDENPIFFPALRPQRQHNMFVSEVNGPRRVAYRFRLGFGEDRERDLRMRALGNFEVTTKTSSGDIVPGVNVKLRNYFTYNSGVPAAESWGHTRELQGTSDADGKITFERVWEGRVDVSITDPITGLRGRGSGLLEWDGETREITVWLQPSGTVRGTVLLSDGVTPAAYAIVALDAAERSWQLQYADENGVFEFTDIPLGSYKLITQQADGPGSFELHSNLGSDLEVDDHTMTLDDEDPFVTEIEPAFGSQEVARDGDIVVTFSEPMRGCGGSCWDWVRLEQISPSPRPGVSYHWSADQTELTVRPTSPLKNATGYKLIVDRAMKDLARRRLAWRVVSSFYTADTVPPKVIEIRPRPGAVQVPVDSSIQITFSEEVDLDTLSGAFEVVDTTAGESLTVTTLPSLDDRRVTLTPTAPFETDRFIEVRVSDVADGSGNVMDPFVSTFVTPDVTLPVIEWTSPSPGQVFTAGDAIDVAAEITDNRGIEHVLYRFGEWTKEMGSPPFDWRIPAPVMEQAGPVQIEAEATDIYGNVQTSTLEIWVEPLENASPPEVSVGCPVHGDLVAPGLVQPVSFDVLDDLSVESVWLTVDGERVGEITPLWKEEDAITLDWIPDADATPGQSFQVALEARDFAGNVTSVPLVLSVPSSELLTGDQVIADAGDLALAGGVFSFDQATFVGETTLLYGATLQADDTGAGLAALQASSLRLQCGAEARLGGLELAGDLTVEKGSELGPLQAQLLHVAAANVLVEEGGTIDGRGWGYEGKNGTFPPVLEGPWGPPGYAKPTNGGGSHGGRGAATETAGDTYDSVYAPHLGGGGGYSSTLTNSENGGFGGGAVWLDVTGTVRLDGDLDVRGTKSAYDSPSTGGAGGSVRVAAQRLEGSASILAAGADTISGGGGGRIVLTVPEILLDIESQVDARGGVSSIPYPNDESRIAGAGTILVEDASSVYGTLIVDGGAAPPADTIEHRAAFLTPLGELAVQATQAQGSDLVVYIDSAPVEARLGAWLGAFARVLDVSGTELGTHRVLEASGGALTLEGAAAHAGVAGVRGVYRFDRLQVKNAKLLAEDAIEVDHAELSGETLLDSDFDVVSFTIAPDSAIDVRGRIEAHTLTVGSGAILRPDRRTDLDIEVAGLMTVEAGARVHADGRGYEGGPGPEGEALRGLAPAGVVGSMSGGSHGGHGHFGSDHGEVYGSVYQPRYAGGGGRSFRKSFNSHTFKGGNGGGIVRLRAGELQLDGSIRAKAWRGEEHEYGGAGGTVLIETALLSGGGEIVAQGADGGESAGGGGRVALYADALVGFDPQSQVTASGGTDLDYADAAEARAGAGTIFVFTQSSTYGDLFVDGEETSVGTDRTPLPALGSWTIGLAETDSSDPADLWIEPQDSGAVFDLGVEGMWARIGGVDYRILAETGDRRRILLDGAATTVSVGQAVSGVYKFDHVTVAGKAVLSVDDYLEAAELTASTGGEIEGPDVETGLFSVPAGSTVEVAGLLRAGEAVVSGTLRSPRDVQRLAIETDRLVVAAGGVIHADGRGYEGGPGPEGEALRGLAPSGVGGSMVGGSHGGHGHAGGDDGEAYGSVYRPRFGGGGGVSFRKALNSHTFKGGQGGGIVEVVAGEVVLDGEIRANGFRGEELDYGGAGGSVRIETATLSGSGTIEARGADGDLSAGGGGRIALWTDALVGFEADTQTSAAGGEDLSSENGGSGDGSRAGAGTVFVFHQSSTFGDLIVDAEESTGLATDRTTLPSLGAWTIGVIEADGADLWIEPQDSGAVFDLGVEGMWVRSGDVDYRVLAEAGDRRRILLEGAAGQLEVGDPVLGVYKFDGVAVKNTATLTVDDRFEADQILASDGGEIVGPQIVTRTFSVPAGSVVEVEGAVEAEEVVVAGTLRTPPGVEKLSIETDRLVVEAGGVISQSGRGYDGGPGPEGEDLRGLAPDGVKGSRVGGSHAGLGDLGSDHGSPYGSVYRPRFGGGGGGSFKIQYNTHTFEGGRGGGVLDIVTGELVLDGEILANGWQGEQGDFGGAGGSVHIDAGSVSGGGLITANGADGNESAGGGGRIALYADQLVGFDPASQIAAVGGRDLSYEEGGSYEGGRAGAGTVLVFTAESTHGDLRVDGDQLTGPSPDRTFLSRFGHHLVGVAEADLEEPANLWIEPQDPEALFDLGVEGIWVRSGGADYRVIAEAGDRRRVLLEGAAGEIELGDEVLGVYKFDHVTITGDAELESIDLLEATTILSPGEAFLDVSGLEAGDSLIVGDAGGGEARLVVSGPIEAPTVTVLDGATLSGVSGKTLRLDAQNVTVQLGGAINADGAGYAGGDGTPVRGAAPEGVSGSLLGGSHAGTGRGANSSSESYGSITRPRFGGGGGASWACNLCAPRQGGAGGGVIEIVADTVAVDGEIRANGVLGQENKHGGAGGTIYIEAATLSGGGDLRARGANGTDSAGGGGRIALIAADLQIDPAAQSFVDSAGDGGAGTVYVSHAASTWGDLYVDGRDAATPLAFSHLPALGEHEIGAVTVDADNPSNLWVETLPGQGDPSLGVEGQIALVQGAEYRILAEASRGTFLLEGAAGLVTPGMMIQGLHRFDNLHVKNGAVLRSVDPVEATAWHIDAGLDPVSGEVGAGGPNCGSGNLLLNPSFEEALAPGPDGQIAGWFQVSGAWADQAGSGLSAGPADGSSYLWPGEGPSSSVSYELRQDIDLSAWAELIDTGLGHAFFTGHVLSPDTDSTRLIVEYLDESGAELDAYDTTGLFESSWRRLVDFRAVPQQTRTVRVRLRAWKAGYGDASVSVGFDAMRFHLLPRPALEVSGGTSVDETSGALTYQMTLGCPLPQPAEVTYQTADGSATAPVDYDAASGTLVFATGETQKSVSVTIHDDLLTEGDETFELQVASTDIDVLAPSTTTTIIDDELGGLVLTLDDAYDGVGLHPGAEVTYSATLSYTGAATLSGARLAAAADAEPAVVPGSVATSAGVVTAEQPLDIDLGSLASGTTVTVGFRAVLTAYPAGEEVTLQLVLSADGIEDVPSDDPATAAVDGDATATPISPAPANLAVEVAGNEEGRPVMLDVSFDDPTTGDVHTASIDWGDLSQLEAPSVMTANQGGEFSSSHRFENDGNYSVRVCVLDAAAHEICVDETVPVVNVAPVHGWQDLRTWTPEHLRGDAPAWSYSNAGTNATQNAESGPTTLLSPFAMMGKRVSGQYRAWDDNGFAGFLVGYSPGDESNENADYLMVIWKRGSEGIMGPGLRLFRIQGVVDAYWDLDASPQATLLASSATYPSTGFEHSVYYDFDIELLAGRFRLWLDGQLEFDIVDDFSGLDGRLGLYNHNKSNNHFEHFRVQTADETAAVSMPLAPFPSRVLFTDFQEEEANEGSNGSANWVVSEAGRRIDQNVESRPSFFYSPENLHYRKVRGFMRVNGDDGFIGFALGFDPGDVSNPDADYVLVVWRKYDNGNSEKGLRAYQVQGIPGNYWTFPTGTGSLTKLADATNYDGIGFDYNTTYRVAAQLEPDRFRLWVGGVLEIDVAGTFEDGRFALFNNAMHEARYHDWTIEGLVVDEGENLPAARVGFEDPGVLDTHSGATITLGSETLPATLVQGSGAVSVPLPSHVATDDLAVDGEACVADSDGATGCGPVPLRVRNVAPVVSAGGPALVTSAAAALDGATFTDPGLDDTHTATVDWGDGSPLATASVSFAAGSGILDAGHQYLASGDFTVTVCVTDDDGGSGCATTTATVQVQEVSLDFSLAPTIEGATVSLLATYSDDSADRVDAASVDWGDGSGAESAMVAPAGDGSGTISASHVFDVEGAFTVTVCALDGPAELACASVPVTVSNAPPANLALLLSGGEEGRVTTLELSFEDASAGDTHTASIDWGDLSPAETPAVVPSVGGGSFEASHVFAQDGDYPARICVQDAASNESCLDQTLTISNRPPRLGVVDFRDFREETVTTSRSGQVAPVWQVMADGYQVDQDQNSYPSVFYGDHQAFGLRFGGRIRMEGTDNDNVGFVIGFEPGDTASPDADYLLVRWKKVSEGAPAGLKLFRVRGVADLTALDGDPNSELLASGATLSSTGWEANKDYQVELEADADGLRLWVDGTLELDVTSGADPFGGGRFGLFTYVQAGYRALAWTITSPDTPPAAHVVPAVENRVFSNHTLEVYPLTTLPAPAWVVSASGLSVLQTANSEPSIFYGENELLGVPAAVIARPESDDDYFGLAFGFDPGEATAADADYLFMTWKGAADSSNSGLHLYRVRGALGGPFGDLASDPNVERLAVGAVTGGDAPWTVGETYMLKVELWPEVVRIWIDGELEFDIAAPVGESFSGGRLGLFAYAQESMRFSRPVTWNALEVDEGTAVPEVAVAFADPGAQDAHTATVDWGDGSSVEAATVTANAGAGTASASGHVYTDDQLAEARLCVDDGDAESCFSAAVRVSNVAPLTSAGGPALVTGTVATLDGATFADPGLGDSHTATVDWGDGSPLAAATVNFTAGSGTIDASHDYGMGGSFTVTVCVTDDDGGSSCDQSTATVAEPQALSIDFSLAAAAEGATVPLSATYLGDSSGRVSGASVDWGDGREAESVVVTPAGDGSGTITASHVFDDDGTFTVTVCVLDGQVELTCASSPIVVSNVAPSTEAGLELAARAGESVALDAASFDDDGAGDSHTATVDWGDGTVDAPTVDATGVIDAQHVYLDDGSFTVTVCVTDDDGAQACDTATAIIDVGIPDLRATLTADLYADWDGDGQPSPGDVLRYEMVVDNVGGGAASSLVARAPLPLYADYVAGSLSATAGVPLEGDPLEVGLAELAGLSQLIITFDVEVDAVLPIGVNSISAQGEVFSAEVASTPTDDPSLAGTADATVTELSMAPELSLSLTQAHVDSDADGYGSAGETIDYAMTVQNVGNGPATGVTAVDLLPALLELVPASLGSDVGVATVDGDSIVLDVASLLAGESATATFQATLVDPLPLGASVLVNQAGAAADGLDIVYSDDPATGESGDPTRLWLAEPGRSSFCAGESFDVLPGWTLDQLGDADEGTAEIVDAAGDGRLRLTGDGSELFHGEDHAVFLHQAVEGDFRVEVDVEEIALDGGGIHRKACLLARDGAGILAAEVMVCYVPAHPQGPTLQFDARLEDGASGQVLASSVSGVSLPLRLALTRRGDGVTVSYSLDGGAVWHEPAGALGGTAVLAPDAGTGTAPPALEVGVAVSAYDTAPVFAAEFDDWRLCYPSSDPGMVAGTPPACDPSAPLDVVYLVDLSQSMGAGFAGSSPVESKISAAARALDRVHARVAQRSDGTRAALLTFRGVSDDAAANLAGVVDVVTPLTTSMAAVESSIDAIDESSVTGLTTTPSGLALEETLAELLATANPGHQTVLVWVTDGLPNIDRDGRGHDSYDMAEVQQISITGDTGDYLPWSEVAWLGEYNGAHGTFDGETLANSMFALDRLAMAFPDLLIYGVGIRGDGQGLGSYHQQLVEYAGWVSGGLGFAPADASELDTATDTLLSDLECGLVGPVTEGVVWNDVDGDGLREPEEPTIGGALVTLTDDQGVELATATTDASGRFRVEDLPPATITFALDAASLPGGLDTMTFDLDGVLTPVAATLAMSYFDVRTDVDFGVAAAQVQAPPEPVTASCDADDFAGASLDPAWTFTSVGGASNGDAQPVSGQLELSSDGTALWGEDRFHLLHQPAPAGDFRVEVEITGVPIDPGSQGFRKGGLHVRSGLGEDSARLMVNYLPYLESPAGPALQFGYRGVDGGAAESLSNIVSGIQLPVRLAIERRGETYTAWYSEDDGATWQRQTAGHVGGSVDLDLGASPVVGVGLASYDDGVPMTYAYDDFALCEPATPAPLPPTPTTCDTAAPLDVVAMLDLSGSMAEPFGGASSRLAAAKSAVQELADQLASRADGSRLALVTFDGTDDPAANRLQAARLLWGLDADPQVVASMVAGLDAQSLPADAGSAAALALAQSAGLLERAGESGHRPVILWLSDEPPTVDLAGLGPYAIEGAPIDFDLYETDGVTFLRWPQVAWLGAFQSTWGTFAGEPLSHAMAELERWQALLPELRVFGLALDGDGQGTPLVEHHLLEWAAERTAADARSAADTGALLAATDDLFMAMTCQTP